MSTSSLTNNDGVERWRNTNSNFDDISSSATSSHEEALEDASPPKVYWVKGTVNYNMHSHREDHSSDNALFIQTLKEKLLPLLQARQEAENDWTARDMKILFSPSQGYIKWHGPERNGVCASGRCDLSLSSGSDIEQKNLNDLRTYIEGRELCVDNGVGVTRKKNALPVMQQYFSHGSCFTSAVAQMDIDRKLPSDVEEYIKKILVPAIKKKGGQISREEWDKIISLIYVDMLHTYLLIPQTQRMCAHLEKQHHAYQQQKKSGPLVQEKYQQLCKWRKLRDGMQSTSLFAVWSNCAHVESEIPVLTSEQAQTVCDKTYDDLQNLPINRSWNILNIFSLLKDLFRYVFSKKTVLAEREKKDRSFSLEIGSIALPRVNRQDFLSMYNLTAFSAPGESLLHLMAHKQMELVRNGGEIDALSYIVDDFTKGMASSSNEGGGMLLIPRQELKRMDSLVRKLRGQYDKLPFIDDNHRKWNDKIVPALLETAKQQLLEPENSEDDVGLCNGNETQSDDNFAEDSVRKPVL